MSKLHIIAVIGLSLILGLVLWQSPPVLLDEFSDKETTRKPTHPDAFLVNARTTQYNDSGHIAHIITSERSNYFEPTDTPPYSLLVKPDIYAYNTEAASASNPTEIIDWQASSHAAKSSDNQETIMMSGDVVLIQQADTKNTPPTRIETETLLIKPNEEYAETDKPVTIKNASGITTATGLTVSLGNNTLELLSNVRSRYEPH